MSECIHPLRQTQSHCRIPDNTRRPRLPLPVYARRPATRLPCLRPPDTHPPTRKFRAALFACPLHLSSFPYRFAGYFTILLRESALRQDRAVHFAPPHRLHPYVLLCCRFLRILHRQLIDCSVREHLVDGLVNLIKQLRIALLYRNRILLGLECARVLHNL